MRILMLTNEPLRQIGGTEVFVRALVQELLALQVEVHIAFHGDADITMFYPPDAKQHSLPKPLGDVRSSTFTMRCGQVRGYAALLQELRPDVVHAHGWGTQIGLDHFEITRQAGLPLMVTHHVPGMTCLQRSLLFLGKKPCHGYMQVGRCTRCRANAFGGIKFPLDLLAGYFPLTLMAASSVSPIARIVAARARTKAYHDAVRACLNQATIIHVLAAWAKELFLRNGVPSEKLVHIGSGLAAKDSHTPLSDCEQIWRPREGTTTPLRLVYWGRLSWEKGVQTLVSALKLLPSLRLDVVILGTGASDFTNRLVEQAKGDSRVRFIPAVSPDDVLSVLRGADVAVIPSLWFETGPLTVLEAQAVKLPIIGSAIGGISELCSSNPGARLFSPGDAAGLADRICEFATDPALVESLRDVIPSPRTMRDVARDISGIYYKLAQN